jgi:hypothetical protein
VAVWDASADNPCRVRDAFGLRGNSPRKMQGRRANGAMLSEFSVGTGPSPKRCPRSAGDGLANVFSARRRAIFTKNTTPILRVFSRQRFERDRGFKSPSNRHWSFRRSEQFCLSVANYNTPLSSEGVLDTGTGSSNLLPSATESGITRFSNEMDQISRAKRRPACRRGQSLRRTLPDPVLRKSVKM